MPPPLLSTLVSSSPLWRSTVAGRRWRHLPRPCPLASRCQRPACRCFHHRATGELPLPPPPVGTRRKMCNMLHVLAKLACTMIPVPASAYLGRYLMGRSLTKFKIPDLGLELRYLKFETSAQICTSHRFTYYRKIRGTSNRVELVE